VIAAAAVARGAGLGPGAARSDAQPTAGVDPRDAPAAGADRVDVHHRRAHGVGADRALAREQRLALPRQRHVVARAAHVERDEIAHAGALGREAGADHRSEERRVGNGWTTRAWTTHKSA